MCSSAIVASIEGKAMIGHQHPYSDALHYKFQELNICNARVGGYGEIFIQQKISAVQYVNN